MKEVVVISLGGSLIIPEKINFKFLDEFKKTITKHQKKYRFVIVCGGGVIARKYISALKKEGKSTKELNKAGIRATRMNAKFMTQFFGKKANQTLPLNMKQVEASLKKNNIVICGALRHSKDSTTDSTAATVAKHFKTVFINMTNVKGLFTDNPKTNKKAKFISEISWKKFNDMASKLKHKPGQHFVLDKNAARLIKKHKTPTYILGSNRALNQLLSKKPFTGTVIKTSINKKNL